MCTQSENSRAFSVKNSYSMVGVPDGNVLSPALFCQGRGSLVLSGLGESGEWELKAERNGQAEGVVLNIGLAMFCPLSHQGWFQ